MTEMLPGLPSSCPCRTPTQSPKTFARSGLIRSIIPDGLDIVTVSLGMGAGLIYQDVIPDGTDIVKVSRDPSARLLLKVRLGPYLQHPVATRLATHCAFRLGREAEFAFLAAPRLRGTSLALLERE